MTINPHNNQPRETAYVKEQFEYYTDKPGGWTNRESKSIFAGKFQKDVFIFAMALAKHHNRKKSFSSPKVNNVSVDAMSEKQIWALLSIGISESSDLLSLKDEAPLFSLAEEYANEGVNILISHMAKYGFTYPKALEAELKEILEEE